VPSPAARIIAARGFSITRENSIFSARLNPASIYIPVILRNSALLWLLLEQRIEFRPCAVHRRCDFWGTRASRCEVIAEIRPVFVDDTLGLGFTTLIVVRGVVKVTIEAYMKRAVAPGTIITKRDPFLSLYFAPAMEAFHIMVMRLRERVRFCHRNTVDSIALKKLLREVVRT
jgi:hypothetical protein